MNEYDIEYIDKLRIHELRDFARRLGVSSPTTLKKDELISKITSIVGQDDSSPEVKNKVLKNYKELDFFQILTSDNPKILSSILNSDDKNAKEQEGEKEHSTIVMKSKTYDENTPYPMYNDVSYSLCVKQNECEYITEDYTDVEGFVDIHPNGYGIVRFDSFVPSDKDSYVPSALVKKHNLKKGQYIVGKAKFIMSSKPKVLFSIDQIDGSARAKQHLTPFEEYDYNGIGEKLSISKNSPSVHRGERVYIANSTLENALTYAKTIATNNSSVNVKFVNIKACPEVKKTAEGITLVNIPFNKSAVEIVNTIELVFERAKREFEMNKSSVVVLYNFSELIKALSIALEGTLEYGKYNAEAVSKLYNLLYLSKYHDKKLSLTIVCIDKSGARADVSDVLQLEFLPIFNKKYENINTK